MKPNKLVRDWLEALRSGNYEQTKGSLRTDDGFCCLGVLCEIYPAGRWENEPFERVQNFQYRNGHHYSMPPNHIFEATDIPLNWSNSLAQMNDDGYSFDQIADCIEHLANGGTLSEWKSDHERSTQDA